MSDLAVLGTRFVTEGADQTNRQLDQYAANANKAARATDALGSSATKTSSASARMQADVERNVREMQRAERAAREYSAANDRAAASTSGLGAATRSLTALLDPMLLATLAVAGAFKLWQSYSEGVRAAHEATARATRQLTDSQQDAINAFSRAASFAEKYGASSAGLSKAIDGVLASQNANYTETMNGLGATDAATQAAMRRAEAERLATVAILRKAAAEADARAAATKDDLKDAEKTAFWPGLVTAIGVGASPYGIQAGQQAQADKLKQLGGDTMAKAIAEERKLAAALKASADELMNVQLILPKKAEATDHATKAVRAHTAATKDHDEAAKAYAQWLASATQKSIAFVHSLEEQIATFGRSETEILAWRLAMEAAAAPTDDLAQKIRELGDQLLGLKKGAQAVEDLNKAAGEFVKMPSPDFDAERGKIEQLAEEFEKARRAADDVKWAADDIYRSIRENDWVGAFAGLFRVLEQLKVAFSKTGDTASKIGAVAGLGQVIGGAVGGTAGSAISGAASGAMAGMQLGMIIPGIGNVAGALIGAALGGIGGLLGGKSEEKQRRQAEELARQQAEHQRALDLTNAKREQEITLLELTGKASEALKMRREAELAAMDASLQATQLKIWALQDEQAAAEARAALDIRLMDAQGRASESLALKRAREIAAANDNERGILREIFAAEDVASARDALSEAYERESSALQATIDKFRVFSDGLKKFRDSLYSGPAAMLSPEEQYKAARAAFDRTSALATGGDEAAIRDLESVSQAYLDASKAYYASSEAYFADLERVRSAVTATQAYAAAQVSTAEAQLSALNASVAGILGVQNAVLSVRDALAGYQAAILAQKAVVNDNALTPPTANDNTPSLPQAADWASYLKHYPDVLAEFNRLSPNNIRNNLKIDYTPEAFGKWHYEHYGKGEGRTPFATGGSFTVGGSGGTDSQAFGPIALSPGEVVNVRRPGDVAADNAALRDGLQNLAAAFKEVVAEVRAGNIQRGAAATETIKKLDQLLDVADDQERATRQTVRAA